MRRLLASLLAIAVVATAFVATGCSSACNERGSPVISLRNPFLVDSEEPTVSTGRARVRWQRVVEEPSPARFTSRDPCAGTTGFDARTAVTK